jgi:hypothetical protein
MKGMASVALFTFCLGSGLSGQDLSTQAQQLESKGDAYGARALLQRAARASQDAEAVIAYAEFLDRYHDPETRSNYERGLRLLPPEARERRAGVARRLVLLDLIQGDNQGASRHLEVYRSAGGADLPTTVPETRPASVDAAAVAEIPGPLRSFSRMAAVSPDVSEQDLLPFLARNVVTAGYQASPNGEALDPTEYMKLLIRYVSQARELSKLAGDDKTIRIATCDSAETGELLRILGYRMRGGCGSEVVLETVNATRAFLTIDSGFPIAALEQALRTNRAFTLPYPSTRVPVLYGADYWVSAKDRQGRDFIDAFLADPSVCRFYLGLSKLDAETGGALKSGVSMARLKTFAHVLDFFGGMFEVRNGKAVVPGGARSAPMWSELVGVSPDQGAAFFERLISKDDGWMASYFDSLARINGPVKDYLVEPQRMKRFYLAIRGRVTSPGPARPVFRSNTDLMLLTTRMRIDPDGRLHIPGGVPAWKTYFTGRSARRLDSRLSRSANTWKDPDDVLEALFALCRKSSENEPLKVFMALTDIDRRRPAPLAPATVDRLAREWHTYSSQYQIFTEGSLADSTILQFLDTADAVSRIGDPALRADVAGSFEALVGLWQVLCRQDAIAAGDADAALAGILAQFAGARNQRSLFAAARAGVESLLNAAHTPLKNPQNTIMAMLAGKVSPNDSESQTQVVQEMVRIFEAQRLVSLDTLFDLADNLEQAGKGGKINTALVGRLASRIADIQLPRASLSVTERNSSSFGYWTERHIDIERKLNLRGAVERAGSDPEKLRDICGSLAPLLRDTLVGFLYAHYAPPGAQILLTNPAFVRSHDLVGLPGSSPLWRYTEVAGSGWPGSTGGRLTGSLAGLPYALADAEQNFLVPSREQALIWGDLVPQIIVTAKIPRWGNVTPAQMHWVGLHMRYSETLLAEGTLDERVRDQIGETLERQAAPARARRVTELLAAGDVRKAIENVTPAEMFVMAQEMLRRQKTPSGVVEREILRLQEEFPDRVNYTAISRAFGTPKPMLTNSYDPELLYLRTFPALMGYSSRIMAESWESPILYWAAVADEVHVSPAQLNVLIPEWTQAAVEKIFANDLEDWQALLRSMRLVGDDVRLRLRIQMDADQKASLQ